MIPNEMKGTFRATILVFALFSLMLGCQSDTGASQDPARVGEGMDVAAETEAIRSVLMRQEEAWNAGDIEAFMRDYVKSDTLRFTSGASVRYGWDSAMQRYLTTYPDRGAMGTLTFSDLTIDVLSPEWALVFGAWHLKREGDHADVGGRYTLLMHNGVDGWKVLYDHTSRAEE